MKRAVLILLLAVIGLLVMGSVYAAGPSQGDWPKPRHDAANSGCSPTTATAVPSIEWIQDTSTHGVTVSYGTNYSGPILDANNIYTNDCGDGPNGYTFGYKRDGTFLWIAKTLPGSPSSSAAGYLELAQDYVNRGGVSLWNNGTNDFLMAGPGGSDPNNAVWFFDLLSGIQNGTQVGVNPNKKVLMSYDTPTVGPDGTIYTYIGSWSAYYTGGTIYAIDGATRQVKWSWGAEGTVPGGKSLGFHFGPMAVTTINGKQVLIVNMAQDKTNDTATAAAPYAPYGGKNLFAIEDDGNTCSVLWSTQTSYSRWSPAISNDGKTVYCASEEAWQTDPAWPGTLYAYDTATGKLKWQINTHAEHFCSPAVGKDGTIYLTSTCVQANLRNDPSGKLIAIQDNGTSAAIKWTMYLDYESDSWLSSPVVNNSNPATVYFGSTSGRLYAVQDMGTNYKLLWAYCRTGAGTVNWPVPIIGNDGSVYAHWNKYLIKFKTGYDGSPLGIHGYVKNPSGDPVKGAYVVASNSSTPLLGVNGKYFVKTDANGYYSITVPAGTWYVEAWADGRLPSDVQSTTTATDMGFVALNDFILPLAGPNLAIGKIATTNSLDNPTYNQGPEKAIDGDRNTRFTSNEANAASVSATNPTWLQVDLGANKTIAEAVMVWENAYAKSYKIQCLPDGVDPTVEANWANATIVSTTTGNWGVPISWDSKGNILRRVELAKFAPVSARYWRLYATATNLAKFFSIWEFELRDDQPAGPASGACGDIRSIANGGNVVIENKTITAVPGAGIPDDTAYVEDSARTGAIRVHLPGLASKGLGVGDVVKIGGSAASVSGSNEKYIEAANITKTDSAMPTAAVVMNSKSAAQPKSQGMFVKMAGKVTAVDVDNFTIDDGGVAVKVMCGTLDKPEQGKTVRVRGVVSTDGSAPVLFMRNEQVDWTYGDAEFQPLPLPGPFKYPREALVCGPFADANSVPPAGATADQITAAQTYRLQHDFIADATNGAQTEEGVTTVQPSEGDPCGDKVWKRYTTGGDFIDFVNFFPTNNTNCTFYAHIYIWSPNDQDIAMRVGSDDSIRVYVNGLNIWENLIPRGLQIGQDLVSYVPLQAGLNDLLLKVEQGTGAAGVNCQFVDPLNTGIADYGGATSVPGLGYVLNKQK